MSHRKDLARAKQYRYRSGSRVPTSTIDREVKAKKQRAVDEALARMGLVSVKPKIILPRR